MKKFLLSVLVLMFSAMTVIADDYQLPNSDFEDWSAAAFNGNPQLAYWKASNVEQVGMKFNFANKVAGRSGYAMMVQDQEVGAMGITETSPAYFSFGTAWQKLEGLNTNSATAGTYGGYAFAHRPDSVSVWIKRTGDYTDKEDFHILYYAWTGTAKGSTYKNKGGGCTSISLDDEESDIRIALDGNECKTDVAGGQVSEGWWRERKTYGSWTNIRVPIYYMNDNVPAKCNLIFSASNYPNFRANNGLYEGNSLYVDDVELIYSSKIHKLEVGEKEWKGFDPNTTDVQIYSLGENATEVPDVVAYRGVGSLTNSKSKTVNFPGRKLSGSEISVVKGNLTNVPTTITVTSEDGKSTTVYKIQFQKAASSNTKLAGIMVNGDALAGFSPSKYNYTVELPYGTTAAPVVAAEKQEDAQTFVITQATSTTGTATIKVTAADGKSTATYTLTFKVGLLADNTLKDILVNGISVPGFTPSQANYKVSLPEGTTDVPTVKAVSAYPEGAQTIEYVLPAAANLNGGSALIKVTTPGNQLAKTYKLTFKIEKSTYSYLKSIMLDGVEINNFEPTNLTYYVRLPLGTTSLPTITWVQGDAYQTVAKEEGGIDGTTRIIVTAGNGDQSVYKLVFSTEKSEISTLLGIKIGGVALAGFSPDVTNYTYQLPVGTTELPEIEPVAHDEYQSIIVNKGNVNGTTRITVTAGNGNTTIYLITFSVEAYTNNTLKSIKVGGVELEGFDPEKNEYDYSLPQGTTVLPEVEFVKQDENLQTVTTRNGGVNGDYRITVRPQSGASRTYIIHFSVATSSNTALANITVDGYALDFHPETLEYHITLAEGVSTIPAVSYEKAEATQRVLSVLEDTIQTITVTAQSGAKREYKIYFKIQLSANAFLEMIYLDGTPLEGFAPEKLKYTVQLTSSVCPKVTVDKAPGQQVTITTPVGAGKAIILVTPETGSSQQYEITFEEMIAASVQLQNILINGVGINGFLPTKKEYTATYEKTLPVVGYEADPTQTVTVMWIGETAWLNVRDEQGNTAAYSVAFSRNYIGNTALASIKADGVELSDWAPEKKDYSYTLASGSNYPTLSYEKGDPTQVVTFGQVGEGKWQFHVIAENGATADYSVQYTIAKNGDATLENIELVGLPAGQTFTFDPNTFEYSGLTLDEGAALPDMVITAKEGQKVISYNPGENEQEVLVMAEDGTTNTYKITYTRVRSSNALLANILIDGVRIAGFEPNVHDYTITLAKGTTVVPNVFPVGQLDNQTITTYFCRPDGTTRIHVEAQDGATADYTIAFPLTKCTNTKLGSLTINGAPKDVNTTEYEFELPYGSVEPYDVQFTKAEDGQYIEYIEAPVTGATKIIVMDENGDKRTYSIRYHVAEPQGENVITKVNYKYVNKTGAEVMGSIVPVVGSNEIELPFGTKSFEVTSYEKKYAEQSVTFYNGGIRRGVKLIASANRDGVVDAVYTIIPKLPSFDTTGKLKDLKFKNVTVPNFRPDVYNYIVNVTTQPTANDFVGTAYDGQSVTKSSIDAKKKQIKLTVDGGEVYSICWYYTNYNTLLDFSGDWVAVTQGVGYKPSAAWIVPADCDDGYTWKIGSLVNLTYTTGKEVTPGGTNGVMLSTLRGAPMNGSVPGMMTLGGMSVSLTSGGNSTSSVDKGADKGVEFKNTPESLEFLVKPLSTSNITNWKMWLTMSDGSNYKESNYTGDFSNLNKWNPVSVPVNYTGVGTVAKFNIMLSSCDQENARQFGGGTIYESSVMYDQIHFGYNSKFSAGTVDGITMDLSGTTFTQTVANDYIGVPALKFSGAVHDQTQTIEWLYNGEWKDGKLTGKVVNYGENALTAQKDSTIYTVVLSRQAVTSTDYDVDLGSYTTTVVGDTTYVNMPFGVKAKPDVTITPESVHQLFEITQFGNTVTVIVTPESGASKKTVYVFRETKSNDAILESIELEDDHGNTVSYETVDADNLIYKVAASKMPNVIYEKKADVHQYIDLNYTPAGAVLKVTAEDGKTTRTYTYNHVDPVVATNGQISAFEIDGNPIQEFGGTSYIRTQVKPESPILFTRAFDSDSIVFVQTPDSMQWQVYGTENHAYTLKYPTDLSSNALLADILVNGNGYSEFEATMFDYTATPIYTNDIVLLTAVAAEREQKIVTAQVYENDGVSYAIDVTAADNVARKQYKLRVERPKSDNMSLAGILVDGVALAGFNPNVLNYTVTLPAPAVKTAQPQMPSVSYIAGQAGQTVELTQGQIGELDPTIINVLSESGSSQEYSVTVLTEPSHCADLTGIMVNGKALESFEPGRHYYSLELNTSDITVAYAADDKFQQYQVLEDGYNRTIHVTAEDGTTTSDYYVTIFVQTQSNDATLSNILLEVTDSTTHMVEIVDFMRTLNPNAKKFDPGLNNYDINLPAGTTVLPAVSAQLKMDGQTVEISKRGKMQIVIKVTAVDGIAQNEYILNFAVPKSQNANLSMIFLDGDSLAGFIPDYYFYQVNLPVGVHSLPEVAVQKGEAHQSLSAVEMDNDKLQATIRVTAEDSIMTNTYVVVFHYTRSDADTLVMVYADGEMIRDFRPNVFFYNDSLPVGTAAFPDLSWAEADDWQTIAMDTVVNEPNSLLRRIHVTAESGKKNTYMFSYTIQKSSADTLQMIYVDNKPLEGFFPTKNEYYHKLSAAVANELNGNLPDIEYLAADTLQTIMVSQAKDSLSGKSLGDKTIISVTAPSGAMRIYTIHYPVETSHDASLNMIMLTGKPMTGFDSQKTTYRLDIDARSSLPAVTVVKKENAQTYDIFVNGDSIQIEVTAEDGVTRQDYLLIFSRLLSDDAQLQSVRLEGHPEFLYSFAPSEYEYLIKLPYGEDTIPAIYYVLSDSLQYVQEPFRLDTLENGDVNVTIHVTAPNGIDETEYILRFQFSKNNDALLNSISLDGTPLEGFFSLISDYVYSHPFGSKETDFFGADQVTYELSDPLATATVTVDAEGTIMITVVAQDGEAESTYMVRQTIAKDNDCALSAILLDEALIRDFDPEITFYTYYLREGDVPPAIEAIARSENAEEPSVGTAAAGDTCRIICTAEDGTERRYYIHFAISSINAGAVPTADDMLIKRVPGAFQLFAASIRQGVSLALYDQYGHLLYLAEQLPLANPNDVEIASDPNRNEEQVADVAISEENGVIIPIIPGQIYMYGFYIKNGTKSILVKSGKIVADFLPAAPAVGL